MFEKGKYYDVNQNKLREYMSNLFPQTASIIRKMIKRGDGKLWVDAPEVGGFVSVAGTPQEALVLGTMKIPADCLVDNAQFQLDHFVKAVASKFYNGERTMINEAVVDQTILELIPEFYGVIPEDEDIAKEEQTSEMSVQDDLKRTAYDDFISRLDDLEASFAAIYLAMDKCKNFGIDVGAAGYPFDVNIQEMYHKIISWNSAQKIEQYKKTGEEPS